MSKTRFIKGVDYVVITELPKEQQVQLTKWLAGQTRPLIQDEEGRVLSVCYRWDYEDWLEHYKKGEVAPVTD